MKRLTSVAGAALVAAATWAPLPGHAAGVAVLDEGFGSLAGLSEWAQINRSMPAGSGWFQGNTGIFSAQSGAANSYTGANYLSAAGGLGLVDNWLITPTLSLNGLTTLSFFTNRAPEPGFFDQLEVRFSYGSNTSADGFDTLLLAIGGENSFPTQWAQWTTSLDVQGEGRFAFRYLGNADTLSYIGLDTVKVITAVPEPSTYLMLLAGLGAVGAHARRLRRRAPPPSIKEAPPPFEENAMFSSKLMVLLPLAALAFPACAQQAAPQQAPTQQGMVVVRDAETGELRAPTADEARALHPRTNASAAGVAATAPKMLTGPGGRRSVQLGERHMVYSVVTRGADGKLEEQCVSGAHAAGHAVKGAHKHGNSKPEEQRQ